MKNLFIFVTALMISTASVAGIIDVYNAVDSNNTSTKVDQKAATLKKKADSKLNKLTQKTTAAEEKSTAAQEKLKAKLESKLAKLEKKGEGNSSQANDIRAEIESLKKLIEAAQK